MQNNKSTITEKVKPRSIPTTMSKQHCRSNIVECYKSNDSFDKVECCFDIVAVFGNNVAGFGNNVERNFVFSTKSKQIEHVQFVSTLSKLERTKFYDKLVRHCCRFGNKVERCFDIVACVDGALGFDTTNLLSTVEWAFTIHSHRCD